MQLIEVDLRYWVDSPPKPREPPKADMCEPLPDLLVLYNLAKV